MDSKMLMLARARAKETGLSWRNMRASSFMPILRRTTATPAPCHRPHWRWAFLKEGLRLGHGASFIAEFLRRDPKEVSHKVKAIKHLRDRSRPRIHS